MASIYEMQLEHRETLLNESCLRLLECNKKLDIIQYSKDDIKNKLLLKIDKRTCITVLERLISNKETLTYYTGGYKTCGDGQKIDDMLKDILNEFKFDLFLL
jgi:hypothetical protein